MSAAQHPADHSVSMAFVRSAVRALSAMQRQQALDEAAFDAAALPRADARGTRPLFDALTERGRTPPVKPAPGVAQTALPIAMASRWQTTVIRCKRMAYLQSQTRAGCKGVAPFKLGDD